MPASEVLNRGLKMVFSSLFSLDCNASEVIRLFDSGKPMEAYNIANGDLGFVDWCIEVGKFFGRCFRTNVSVEGSEPMMLRNVIAENDDFPADLAWALVEGNDGVNYGDGCNIADIRKVSELQLV